MNTKNIIIFIVFALPCILNGMNTQPIVLDSPGLFQLVGALEFGLTSSGQACIEVSSNDVIIDLNQFSVRQAAGFEQQGTIGILIDPDVQNVTIKNGVITHMNNYGIQMLDNTNSIYLTDLVINDVQNAGIFADSNHTGTGIVNLFLTNVTTESVSNLSGGPAYGILFKFVNSARVTGNTLVHNIQTNSGDCYGFKIKDCSSILVDSLVLNDNRGGGSLTTGIYLVNSQDCVLQNCITLNNTCTSSNPNAATLGFGFESSGNIECNTCISVDNDCTFSAIGFFSHNTSGIQYINCQGNGNVSSTLDGAGFSANNGILIELHSCQAKGNGGGNNGYGVFFNGLNSSAIENCDIRGNSGTVGTSYGIDLVNTVTSNITNNTIAYNIGSPTTFGFFDDAGAATTNNILANTAIKNGVNYSPGALTIPIYVGTLVTFDTLNPFTFQNISIP